MSQQPNRPEASFCRELNGTQIEAAIWLNEYGQSGRTFFRYSITTKKQYFDRDTKTWQESATYFPNDLPLLRDVLAEAYSYVTSPDHRRSAASAEPAEAGATV